jgi:hypothetical protein
LERFDDFAMTSGEFFAALAMITGQANADLYARKFRPFDAHFHNDVLNYEALAFFVYTTALEWYETINSELWSDNPHEAVKVFAEVLNSGLRKLPSYKANKSVVYRGYQSPDIAAFSRQYAVGSVITFPGFTSATFHDESAFGGNVFFTIKSLNARVIWYMAADYHEHEVLFPTDCRFRVMENEVRNGRLFLLLEELP